LKIATHISKSKWWSALALLLIFLVALGLRFWGLSHDLKEGYVYHPDTPKQISAIQEYLEGDYFSPKGNLNYDGYPFFTSRLMEWGVRLSSALGAAPLTRPQLFWKTRILNAWLSSLAILATFAIALGISRSHLTALLAAALLAISPVDSVACHYAMGDTTAAFFATLTVLCGVWIFRSGSLWSYVAAGLSVSCAFAAKYHGAAAGVAVIFAHLLRNPHPRQFFGKRSLGCILVTLLATLIMLPIAIPSLKDEPVATIQNIARFLEYTSNFKMKEAQLNLPFHLRWFFGVSHNYPHFAYMLTGGLLTYALLGSLLLVRKHRAILIVAVLPAIYMFVGLPFKPLSHIEYHTLVSPCLFTLAAIALVQLPTLPSKKWIQALLAGASIITLLAAGNALLSRTRYQGFYFSQPDTRRLASEWVYHNLPESFQIAAGHYTYVGTPPTVRTNKMGAVMLSSNFRPHRAPNVYATKMIWDLKDTPLELFRNPIITAYIHRSPWLKPDWQHPTFQTVPYGSHSGILDASAPVFNRNPLKHVITQKQPLQLWLTTPEPITHALLILQAGPNGALCRGRFGKQSITPKLSQNTTLVIPLEMPTRKFPSILKANFYQWELSSIKGEVMATLAITPTQKAIALTQAGYWKEAKEAFRSLDPKIKQHSTLALLGRIANADGKDTQTGEVSENLYEAFGIAEALLATAPAIEITPDQWIPCESGGNWKTEPIFVTPGAYTLENGLSSLTAYQAGQARSLGQSPIIAPFGIAAIELRSTETNCPKVAIQLRPDPAATLSLYRR